MTPTTRTEATTRTTVHGRLTNAQLFTTPLNAMLQNENGHTESVRILGMGDVEGHSPCYLFVDEHGQSNWDSIAKFQIIDVNALPVSKSALAALGRAVTGDDTDRSTR